MLQAAKIAGIHPVTLIKEPEAAALYTLTSHDHSIKPGDSFVVCDGMSYLFKSSRILG